MSVFDNVPDPLPFDADISQRPATFVLHPERVDRYIIGFIALFWLVFIPIFGGLFGGLLVLLADLRDYLVPVVSACMVGSIAAWFWWWWAEFRGTFRHVEVTVSSDSVDVHERDLIRNRKWSHPLSGFEGIGLVSLGTRLVGFSKRPLAAVMLVHSDPSRSIPLAIAGTNQLGRPNLGQKARQLGLPVLQGVAAGKAGKVYPADAIVVNRYQALKFRLVLAGFALASLFAAGAAIRHHGTADADFVWPVVAAIFAAALIAMYLYARHYVIDLKEEDGGIIALRSGAFLSPWRRFPRAAISAVEFRQGRMLTDRHSVHTPYAKMRVDGYRFAFVIDMQSDFVDEGRLRGLAMRARPRAPSKKRRRR